ncbi:MAG: tryptophan-rich sensory protein [Acidobacteria bacterium]|nr:tryptophan-rich sensory protein [Acidobacteriota bacterium]
MNDKLKQFLVIAATVATLVFNWLAATGILGGVATNVVSDNFQTRITPAGYAFAIWSLIYTGLIAFSVYQAMPRNTEKFRALRTPYIVSCVLNCAWLYFWAQEALIVCLVLIALLLAVLFFINSKLIETETNGDYWLVKAPFGIYCGWVTAATLVNAMIVLVYLKVPVAGAVWLGAVFIFVAAAFGVGVRIALSSHLYPLAIAWALTAIAVKQSGATMIVVSCAVGVIACLLAAVSFVMEKPSRF